MKYKWLLLVLLLVACEDTKPTLADSGVELKGTVDPRLGEQDENGYYKVGYSGFNYVQVFAQSEGLQRIFWSSSDSFTVVHMGIEFNTSIAYYSTYTNSENG